MTFKGAAQKFALRRRIIFPLLVLLLPMEISHCAPTHQAPTSDHFDGKRFHNREPVEKGLWDVLKWSMVRTPTPWPDHVENPPFPAPPKKVEGANMRVTFVNHATTLIQVRGVNILTDPMWSKRCSPVDWAGPARIREPGVAFDDLPRIHAVLLSHDHYDHLDLPTLQRLNDKYRPRFYAGLGTRRFLEDEGIADVVELDWWQEADLGDGLRLVFLPAQHWARRTMSDTNKRLWGSFALHTPHGNIYFAGDTGYGPHFKEIGEKHGPFRLALLPIGAYEPRWFMKQMHMNPDEAVQAHMDLRSQQSLGIHHSTFQLTDEGIDEPVEALDAAVKKHKVSEASFWVLGFGEGREVPFPSVQKPQL